MEHESDGDNNCNRWSWYTHQMFSKGTGRLGNNRTSGDHPNYWIVEIDQNTEKSHGDLKRFVVAQSPMKRNQLTLL